MSTCLLCGSAGVEPTEEHVIPRWARRALAIQGGVTISASDGPGTPKVRVGWLPDLNITLTGAICRTCNNECLSRIENKASRIL